MSSRKSLLLQGGGERRNEALGRHSTELVIFLHVGAIYGGYGYLRNASFRSARCGLRELPLVESTCEILGAVQGSAGIVPALRGIDCVDSCINPVITSPSLLPCSPSPCSFLSFSFFSPFSPSIFLSFSSFISLHCLSPSLHHPIFLFNFPVCDFVTLWCTTLHFKSCCTTSNKIKAQRNPQERKKEKEKEKETVGRFPLADVLISPMASENEMRW